VSIYTGTQLEREYAAGVDDGRAYAETDRAGYEPAGYWLDTFAEEIRNAPTRGLKAYYLGALRGYREVVRTQREGKWGT
jgi:hypothetical protein